MDAVNWETPIGSGTWWFEEVLTKASKCKKDALHAFIAMAAEVGSSCLLWNWQELTLCEIGAQYTRIRYNWDVIMKNIQKWATFCSLMTRNLAVDFEANVWGEDWNSRIISMKIFYLIKKQSRKKSCGLERVLAWKSERRLPEGSSLRLVPQLIMLNVVRSLRWGEFLAWSPVQGAGFASSLQTRFLANQVVLPMTAS